MAKLVAISIAHPQYSHKTPAKQPTASHKKSHVNAWLFSVVRVYSRLSIGLFANVLF